MTRVIICRGLRGCSDKESATGDSAPTIGSDLIGGDSGIKGSLGSVGKDLAAGACSVNVGRILGIRLHFDALVSQHHSSRFSVP